ncbi:MAG: hypothetical protein B7733_10625 [Myxococcales bacterium FL481]|nr:MAG: hypothetical protein B7733_10625 [Myxococcales bacterium FL481]
MRPLASVVLFSLASLPATATAHPFATRAVDASVIAGSPAVRGFFAGARVDANHAAIRGEWLEPEGADEDDDEELTDDEEELTDDDEDAEPEGPDADEGDDEAIDDAGDAPVNEPVASASDERGSSGGGAPGQYNAHGVGMRVGLTMVPTWILTRFLASHTNALCRGESIGGFAADRGLTKQDGCNYYIGGEYIYRKSRTFDIVATVGYQRARLPDGLWLDADEWADDCQAHDGEKCNLAAADYTEVDMGFVFVQADFIGRLPVIRTPNYELAIGGGGGVGLGILVGDGVHQTPLGNDAVEAGACQTFDDLSDFTRCTPAWFDDPDIDQDGDGSAIGDTEPPDDATAGEDLYANCTADDCSVADLNAFGSRLEQEDVPAVIPVINLVVSARMVIKDSLGLVLSGGFNTGFYFGGGVQYFFGGGGK